MFKLFKAKTFSLYTVPHTTVSRSVLSASQYVVTIGSILGIGYFYARTKRF